MKSQEQLSQDSMFSFQGSWEINKPRKQGFSGLARDFGARRLNQYTTDPVLHQESKSVVLDT